MNQEETIFMNQGNDSEKSKNPHAAVNSKGKKESKTASMATVAAAAFGGAAVGGVGTAAAETLVHTVEPETDETPESETTDQGNEQTSGTTAHDNTPKPESAGSKTESEEIPVSVDDGNEIDYTGNNGADPVVTENQTGDDTNGEVEVLDIYEQTTEEGVTVEVGVITDGEEVAIVVDGDGDGVADAMGIDHNHNNQIDEGEVYDISSQNIQMSDIEEAYVAQHPEVAQQDTQNEVQVLGIQENTTDDGICQEAAILTDGETVAVVADLTGDGVADVIAADMNGDGEINEGEVYDISSEQVQMSQYEDAYIAQQQEMEHDQNLIANNYADDQQDYNNDAPDLTFA